MSAEVQVCLRCGEELELNLFPKDSSRKNGIYPYCKKCKSFEQRNRNKIESEARRRLPKRCRKCKRLEPEVSFPSRLSHHCWNCHEKLAEESKQKYNERSKKAYSKNNLTIKRRQQIIRSQRKSELIKANGGKCIICGLEHGKEWPGACFDFHHRYGKDAFIGKLIHSWKSKYGQLIKELKKCDLLCSNCHRRLHFIKKVKELKG